MVHVAPGTYNENVRLSNATPGTASAPVTYISDTKWAAALVASVSGNQSAGIYNNEPYSIVENFDISGPECTGIQLDNTHQSAVGNNVHNSANNCESTGHSGASAIISSNYGVGVGYNNALGNFVHDVAMNSTNPSCYPNDTSSLSTGIYWQNPYGIIDNNLVVNVCGTPINLWHGASNETIVNNTVVNSRYGIQLGSGDAPCSTTGCPGDDYTVIYNNIVVGQSLFGIYTTFGDGGSIGRHNQVAYNLAYNNNIDFSFSNTNVTCSPGCMTGKDPLFVNNTDTSSGNYQLQSGSPAIGAGTTTNAPSTDYVGNTRTPPITIGAYQFGAPLTSPLLAYWKLDDASGTVAVDSSGNNNTMSLVNSPAWQPYTNCVLNGCLSFSGTNQYGSVSLDLSTTNVITIAFWMKWNAFQNDDKLAFEFSSNFNNSTTGFLIDPDESSSGKFWISVHGNAGYNNAAFTRPSAGVWHHYAFVLNKGATAASEVTPYVDGIAVPYTKSAYSVDNTNSFGSNTLFVMSRNGSSLFGAGSLDDVRIYTTALSAAQIAALAQP